MRGLTTPISPVIYFGENRWITYPKIEPYMYSISEYGEIINHRRRIQVTQHMDRYGYIAVYMKEPGKDRLIFERVHRLVAWEFCPNRDMNLEVNHIDGNKSNNHYTNLEWVDRRRNIQHAAMNGLRDNNLLLKPDQVESICELLQNTDMSYSKILKSLSLDHIHPNVVSDLKLGKSYAWISDKYDFSHRDKP